MSDPADLVAYFEADWDQCMFTQPRQTAYFLGVSEEQLQAWHDAGVGPQYELGPDGSILYFTQMVLNYSPGRPFGHTRGSHLRLVRSAATGAPAAGIAP